MVQKRGERGAAALVSIIIESHKCDVFLDGAPLKRPVRPVQMIAVCRDERPDVQLWMSHSAQLQTSTSPSISENIRHRNGWLQ